MCKNWTSSKWSIIVWPAALSVSSLELELRSGGFWIKLPTNNLHYDGPKHTIQINTELSDCQREWLFAPLDLHREQKTNAVSKIQMKKWQHLMTKANLELWLSFQHNNEGSWNKNRKHSNRCRTIQQVTCKVARTGQRKQEEHVDVCSVAACWEWPGEHDRAWILDEERQNSPVKWRKDTDGITGQAAKQWQWHHLIVRDHNGM